MDARVTTTPLHSLLSLKHSTNTSITFPAHITTHVHAPTTAQKLAGASVLILANKQDLQGALSAEEIAQALDLRSEQFARRHWTIVGCSAVTGAGLKEGIGWIVGDIASRIFMLG